MSSNTSQAGGIGFFGLLAIVFIALKLTDVIDWSWLWVLSPLWLPFTMLLIAFIVFALLSSDSRR